MKLGLDIGSTTIKCVLLDENEKIIYSSYERHFSQIIEKAKELFLKINDLGYKKVSVAISGSAGMGLADKCGIPFIQEVYATRVSAKKLVNPDCIIELGGEDAKILFLTNGLEVRMNGSCAGGTGAFIDQMATLLNMTHEQMNNASKESTRLYSIASRCGVFAKSDIQPLINQAAKREDICSSIFKAVANQTIAGLAQGRPIEGKVLYLGGPLTFLSELRRHFDESLNTTGVLPENSLYFVSIGAAYLAKEEFELADLVDKMEHFDHNATYNSIPPLFKNKEEFEEFTKRHNEKNVKTLSLDDYNGNLYLGIDAGSTTCKIVLIDDDNQLRYSSYQTNNGNPVPIVKKFLDEFYAKYPSLNITASCVTGYGENLIQNAFGIDFGLVETMAHYEAAKSFCPDVEFIIDIGGQDIKCFKIKNGAIDNIFLNEACSSGCGSFLQTFANALGKPIDEFAQIGLFADRPVDLGSRCTVFMNSSVKQAQKDGATIENISAGLSISVVKNALYKVIRATTKEELGEKIVVQGGTFLNNAVLRAFERELDLNVTRPNIAGLMGAYGSALYAKKQKLETTSLINKLDLEKFKHDVKTVNCGLCQNNCSLTVNTFGMGKKFISGNRCERPITKRVVDETTNMYEYKRNLIRKYQTGTPGPRGKIGIPLGLNMYELLPFWNKFFTALGFEVVVSPFSDRKLYINGQSSIPSDTVCFPAKLMHGHVEYLLENGINTIFYPCMSYNIDEGHAKNHYNCPVVAYYPEVLAANMTNLNDKKFIYDYIGLHTKEFPKKIYNILNKYFVDIKENEVKNACKLAFEEYHNFEKQIKDFGQTIIEKANRDNKQIIVLAGRPYHIDPEINHDIDKLMTSLGVYVISEDVISDKIQYVKTNVLNQWTYHARLYSAAKYVTTQKNMNLVQLVSFGCGVDAITTDEVRSILENGNKIYTQIKIDEITNLGAVKIRLRSLLSAIAQKEEY